MDINEYLAVAVGGALGAVARFALSTWVQNLSKHREFPWGIFICNALGSLAIGILAAILIHRLEVGPLWRAFILIGVLGGFTTFSSFSLDTFTLLQAGDVFSAVSNVLLSVFVCLIATAGGFMLASVWR